MFHLPSLLLLALFSICLRTSFVLFDNGITTASFFFHPTCGLCTHTILPVTTGDNCVIDFFVLIVCVGDVACFCFTHVSTEENDNDFIDSFWLFTFVWLIHATRQIHS